MYYLCYFVRKEWARITLYFWLFVLDFVWK